MLLSDKAGDDAAIAYAAMGAANMLDDSLGGVTAGATSTANATTAASTSAHSAGLDSDNEHDSLIGSLSELTTKSKSTPGDVIRV